MGNILSLLLGCRFRDLLVEAAVAEGLVAALLQRLDWRSGGGGALAAADGGGRGGGDRDASVARVLAVGVLRLLAAEGPHSAQVPPAARRRPPAGTERAAAKQVIEGLCRCRRL